jgi:hypothetical protein
MLRHVGSHTIHDNNTVSLQILIPLRLAALHFWEIPQKAKVYLPSKQN